MMNKFVYSFFFLMATTALIFLTSCEEDPELPGGDPSISLSPSDDVQAAPGETVEVTVTLTNVEAGTQATAVSNPGGSFVNNDNTAASGESVSFVVPEDAEIGEVYTLTFSVTSGGAQANAQLDITVGFETVVEIASSSDDFSILVAALTQANLVATLQGDGPFTVFAPTNDAFAAIGIDSEADFPDDEALTQLLLYHVVSGAVMADDLEAGKVATVEGSEVTVSLDPDVQINDATVTIADLVADNGVVHIVDKVLLPESTVGTATAVLLGGQLNLTYGSFYNVLDNEVYKSDDAETNGDKVDLLYWYTETSGSIIGSPDNEFAAQAFVNTDFTNMTNATRFKTLTVSADDFDAIVSQKDLTDAFTDDAEADASRLTDLAEEQVFAFVLDEARGSNIGLIKVVDISGTVGNDRQIQIEVKYVK